MKITLVLSDEVKNNPSFYPVSYGSPITGIKPYSKENKSTWVADVNDKEIQRLIKKYTLTKTENNLFESKDVKLVILEG